MEKFLASPAYAVERCALAMHRAMLETIGA